MGDIVRTALPTTSAFQKSYRPQFSKDLFRIHRILNGDPPRYGICSLDKTQVLQGMWYAYELSAASLNQT